MSPTSIPRYLHSSDAKQNTDPDVCAALDALSEVILKNSTRKRPSEAVALKPPKLKADAAAADEEERGALALICESSSKQSRLMQVQKNPPQWLLSSRACCRHHCSLSRRRTSRCEGGCSTSNRESRSPMSTWSTLWLARSHSQDR